MKYLAWLGKYSDTLLPMTRPPEQGSSSDSYWYDDSAPERELLRAMRAASNAALALEQAVVKEYTESRLGKLINPVLDYFTLRRYEEVYKKKAIGIVTSNLQDLQKDLRNNIVWASRAKDSIEGMAARFPLQKLVEVRRGLTEEDTLVVHCVQAASSEALREAQLYRRELNIALMSQKYQWNSEYT